MTRTLRIDPITRLEGHGFIDIFVDDDGSVSQAVLRIPELRGFEAFSVGRPAEDMPQITSRICGVCPTAHHMASTKALDDLYQVQPPLPAKLIRELVYNTFMLEDHALHVYILGGPDLIVGPQAPKAQRNILGVIDRVGRTTAEQVITMRRRLRELITAIGGKVIHPVLGLPGGVAKALQPEVWENAQKTSVDAYDFALFTLEYLKSLVQSHPEYADLLRSPDYRHETYYMGLVDENYKVNFYDGNIRVVRPDGSEFALFPVRSYRDHLAERVEPWTYVRFMYLKSIGWHGFSDGPSSGIYSVAPLARINASEGFATPRAQEAYEEYLEFFGGKPVHFTLANHWARVVEMVYTAERIKELVNHPDIQDPNVRTLPEITPRTGIGVVEAPRGTLIHHYETDESGIITRANLLVATQHNSARINLSVDRAAKAVLRDIPDEVPESLLNRVEMAFRAYDPCHACATHAAPGEIPLVFRIYNRQRRLIKEWRP